MAYIIPNATDTTSGNKYAVLDQAEPDSIDFEILGNDKTGVISGCAVTPTIAGSNSAVSVAGGVVVLNNVVYTVDGNSFLNIATQPSDSLKSRFDLIVARLNGSTMVLTGLYGTESVLNPTHPKSSSRLVSTLGLEILSYFNPATDVVLASVYRAQGITAILASHIVDKRRDINTPIAYRSNAYPISTTGDIGDLYLRTSALSNGESGVHVKRDASTWVQLAATPVDPGVPIGTVITWVSPVAPNGAVWVECKGDSVLRSTYELLFNVLTNNGTEFPYGYLDSTHFNLPDFRGYYLAGLPSVGGALGTAAGNTANTISVGLTNMPLHQHSINHGHARGTAHADGEHTHTPSATNQDFATRLSAYKADSYIALQDTIGEGYPNSGLNLNFGLLGNPGAPGMALSYATNTSKAETHEHSVTIPTSTTFVSGDAGQATPTPINIQPKTLYVKYYIRYA